MKLINILNSAVKSNNLLQPSQLLKSPEYDHHYISICLPAEYAYQFLYIPTNFRIYPYMPTTVGICLPNSVYPYQNNNNNNNNNNNSNNNNNNSNNNSNNNNNLKMETSKLTKLW